MKAPVYFWQFKQTEFINYYYAKDRIHITLQNDLQIHPFPRIHLQNHPQHLLRILLDLQNHH